MQHDWVGRLHDVRDGSNHGHVDWGRAAICSMGPSGVLSH